MKLSLCALAPHPPIILPEVGGGESAKVSTTDQSMDMLSSQIADINPEVVIVISPHGPVFADAVGFLTGSKLSGDLGRFGAREVNQVYELENELSGKIVARCADLGVSAAFINESIAKRVGYDYKLDHGIMVPMQYLWAKGLRPKLVALGMAFLPFEDLYACGMAIQQAVAEYGSSSRNAVLIASGDLSHRLSSDAPNGYDPKGPEFDSWLVDKLKSFDVEAVVGADRTMLERAGECGFRPVVMLMGALDGQKPKSQVLSYEGPFGVGYCVATFEPSGEMTTSKLPGLIARRKDEMESRRRSETPPVQLARRTVESYIRYGTTPAIDGIDLPDLPSRAGVFVSLKKHGELRGCIGTTGPTQPTVAQEIIHNAIEASTADPRFEPVSEDELDDLVYSVDVLAEPEPIADESQLDPIRYGVIVRSGGKSGLLLPNLEGVETVAEQLSISKRKAGIRPGEPVTMMRFEVVRYK